MRDPLVGRDLLLGVVLGAFGAVLISAFFAIGEIIGTPFLGLQKTWDTGSLRGLVGAAMSWAGSITQWVLEAFGFVTILVISRLLLRRDAMVVLAIILLSIGFNGGVGPVVLVAVYSVLSALVLLLAFLRVGLLAMTVCFISYGLLTEMPLTFSLTAWWAPATWITVGSLVVVVLWGFRISVAGQPLLRDSLLQE